jgi:hypothetical protein
MFKPPIYLAGIERSGTSLMYALLASHPGIAMTRRTNLWTYFYNRYGDISQPENFERCLAMMMQYKRLRLLNPDPERIRHEFLAGEEKTYPRLFALLEEHFAEGQGKPRWGDKSLNTERFVDPILAAYPEAKMIHMMRDPRDRFASARTRWKSMKGLVGAGTAMWLQSAHLAENNQARYPDQYLIIHYETLAAHPEETLQQVCDFIEEPYDPCMLTMKGSPRLLEKGSNSSYGKRKAGAISTDSIARYRKVLHPTDIAFIQSLAQKKMSNFGYPVDDLEFSPGERLRFLIFDWPVNFARMLIWIMKETFLNIKGRSLPARRLISNASQLEQDSIST